MNRYIILTAFAAMALLFVRQGGLPAGTSADSDVSGEWSLVLTHPEVPDYTGNCLTFVVQSGTDLTARFLCAKEYDLRPESFASMDGSVQDQPKAFTLTEDLGLGAVFQFTLTLSQDGTTGSGTWVSPHVSGLGTVNALRTTGRWGDADCNGTADSRDALSLLQRIALLTSQLQCGGYADTDVNGVLDSRDALLILQVEAGLSPRLPVL